MTPLISLLIFMAGCFLMIAVTGVVLYRADFFKYNGLDPIRSLWIPYKKTKPDAEARNEEISTL